MNSRIVFRLITLLIVVLLPRSICSGDELVYRHYLERIVGRIESGSMSSPSELAIVANRLMSINWPDSMEDEVRYHVRSLFIAGGSKVNPSVVSVYAKNLGTLPDFLQRAILEKFDSTDRIDKFYLVEALCKGEQIPDEIVPALEACARDEDVVLSTAATVELFHASSESETRRKQVSRLLSSDNPEILIRVAERISLLPPDRIAVFFDLLENGLSSTDSRVQVTSANAILSFDVSNGQALRIFASLSRNEDAHICVGYSTPSNQGISLAKYVSRSLRAQLLRE